MRHAKVSRRTRYRRRSDQGVTIYASKRENVRRKTKWPRLVKRHRKQFNPETPRYDKDVSWLD